MKLNIKTILIILFSLLFGNLFAQNILSLQEVIDIAIEKNYNVLISANQVEMARINNTLGNAGMMPQINFKASDRFEFGNSYQKFSDGSEADNLNFTTNILNAGPELNWTVFDGGRMFATKHRLEVAQEMAEIAFEDEKLQIKYNVSKAYFDVVKNIQLLKAMNDIIEISQQRLQLSENAYNNGMLNKSDLLQSQIDLNISQKNIVEQDYIIEQAYDRLKVLMGTTNQDFIVDDEFETDFSIDFDVLNEKFKDSNTSLLILEKQMNISEFSMKESKRNLLPRLNINAAYNLYRTVNSSGNIIENFSFGPHLGASLVIPIYQSGDYSRQVEREKINFKDSEYKYHYYKDLLTAELKAYYLDFLRYEKLIELESENFELTEENINISLNRLELGKASSLEVHQAQSEYLQSLTRLINYKYNQKLCEIGIKLLTAEL